ncbi:carboxypeptidase B-like [Eriocheir sinensis]|uniref:carboxypeptidase B-like n=1 Tax=Eriocheir sinensis TaxID=95602 RepID=UPI0021C865BC|nr:carboxypeptidase B-like [Eriocheir sinensis]
MVMALMGPHWLSLLAVVASVVEAGDLPSPDNYRALAGHQVWETEDPQARSLLAGLEEEGLADILGHTSSVLRFRVDPEGVSRVSDSLLKARVDYRVAITDLESHYVEMERVARRDGVIRAEKISCTSDSCPIPLIEEYMEFTEIEWYLKELAAQSSRVELESIGKSIEGRDIWRVIIRAAQEGEGQRKAVWLEGGLHAREWISPAVTINLIHKIATDESFLPAGIDVYAVPMANPDGYVYSWTGNRLWRKNRRRNDGSRCRGVDLNRNWDMKFGVGASSNPCSETYKGVAAFSEPETVALSEEMTRVAAGNDLKLMVALHCYGQVLLYPWGWTSDPAPNKDEMIKAGNAFAKAALKGRGRKYSVANSGSEFYYAAGATDDWAKGKLGTPYSYTLELPDEGNFGFTLPADRIPFTFEEVKRGIIELIYVVFNE